MAKVNGASPQCLEETAKMRRHNSSTAFEFTSVRRHKTFQGYTLTDRIRVWLAALGQPPRACSGHDAEPCRCDTSPNPNHKLNQKLNHHLLSPL